MKRTTVTVAWLACLACLGSVGWVFAGTLFHRYPVAMLTIKAVDEDDVPLPDTSVHVWLSEGAVRDGKTDRKGLFVAKGECTEDKVPISVGKSGYYPTAFAYAFPEPSGARWEPWNPVVTAVVRRVVNPIPMYAKRLDAKIPATNEFFGFDLAIGDWVQPVGKGVVSDLLFRIEGFWRNYRDNDSILTLTFSQVSDGLVMAEEGVHDTRSWGSSFVMPRFAPTNGYSNVWMWRRMRRQSGTSNHDEIIDETRKGRDYIVRIRSQTNELGVVTNACYGKLHGSIEYAGAAPAGKGSWLRFTYYLNPTPNDRNLEFDPQRNLFKNLGEFETVSQP